MERKREERCQAFTSDGKRCTIRVNLRPFEGELRCIHHDPNRRGRAKAMYRRGGRNSARQQRARAQAPPAPTTLDEAVRYAAWIVHAVAVGHLDAKRGQVMQKSLDGFMRGLKDRDLAKQVSELQAQLKQLKKGAPR